MSGFENIQQVYFLGIGGIGMSALARYFNNAGFQVGGYDRTETVLTCELAFEGIVVHYEDRPDWLVEYLRKDQSLVVYTPAVPADMAERVYLEQNGFLMKKRSEVLGMICDQLNSCAVSGTHGKTSVTTMLGHIMYQSKLGCTAFLGGISKNYDTNLLLNNKSKWMVAEADEFDRSFLRLHPNHAVITSMDADHLDIYGTHDEIIKSFNDFVGQIKAGGSVIAKKGLPVNKDSNREIQHYSYSLSEEADFYAANLQLVDEAYQFNLMHPKGMIENIRLNYPGLMNVENAVAASALALQSGVSADEIRSALASYKGVKRRFDVRYRSERYILIDDYAHHPEELKATITSVKKMFAGRHVTGIFQPHLYSRTLDHAEGFARELDELDEIILLDIYPAREKPIPGVESDLIFQQMKNQHKKLISKCELKELACEFEEGVVLMMGAGDIDTLVEPVRKIIEKKDHA